MELTKRQWKALVTAYPLYHDEICSQLPSQGTSVDGGNAPRSRRSSNVADLTAHTSDEDVPYIVSKVALAFGVPTSDTGPAVHDTLHRSASTRVGVPVLMDKLLRLFFFGEAAVRDKAQDINKKELQAVEWTGYGPLGASELYLLGMCAKEQARVRYYSGMYAALTASLQALATQHPCNTTTNTTTAVCNGGRANCESTSAACMMLPHTTNEERMRQSRQHHQYSDTTDASHFTVNGAAMQDQDEQVSSFTSALAHVPVRHSTTSSMAAFIAQQQPHVFTGNSMTNDTVATNALGVMAVCEACHEPGGDLFRCSQCNSLLHEICGGPHPPDMGALSGKSGQGAHSSSLTMLCKSCRRALHVGSSSSSSNSTTTSDEGGRKKSGSGNSSSSSSSLRSSTSTSEREAIDAYFGPDTSGDEDTSLSGFIVHTDEDEEEENEDEEKVVKEDSSESEEGQAEPKKVEGSEKQQKQVTQVSSSSSSSSSSSLPHKVQPHKAKRSRSGSAARQHAPHHRRYKLVLSASTSSDDDDGSVTDV